jgi:hypothetical protein
VSGLARFADALEAIGYYAARRNCPGCRLCSDDAWSAYTRVGDCDPSDGRWPSWVLRGFCPDEAEADTRREAWLS